MNRRLVRVPDASATVALFEAQPALMRLLARAHAGLTGGWPGTLDARHAVYDANLLRGVVGTAEPGLYRGLRASLRTV